MLQLLILAGVALFLVFRLRSVLGTRDGFEGPPRTLPTEPQSKRDTPFEVIEGGGADQDIADHVDPESPTGKALAEMKKAEPGFSVSEFAGGARQAYEMVLMAYETGDRETLEAVLSPEIYPSFEAAIAERESQGLTVEANFVGVREVAIADANYDRQTGTGEITMRFQGELTSVVKDPQGRIVEGDATEIRRQKDVWTFARAMGSEDPNWQLVATGA